MIKPVGLDKESFRNWILACCDTFIRNEDKLYAMYQDGTHFIDITFPLRVNEVASMEIIVNKVVQNNDEKIIVIKSLEDKEIDKNENKDGNDK